MDKNEVFEEINEEVVSNICEVDASTGNVVVKIAVGALVIAAGVGTALYLKKRKKNKVDTNEVKFESDMVIENDKDDE